MNYKVFKLKFKGFTHFGETGIDLENVSERVGSDTLFSAWLNAIKSFFGEKKATEVCQNFLKKPLFRISSLFLSYEDNYFLPKPLSAIPAKENPKVFKKFKKTNWISLSSYPKWLNREVSAEEIEKAYILQENFYQKAYKKIIRPRLALDRESSESNLFHEGYLSYENQAGLWGIVVGDEENLRFFMEGLFLLGELGLGGEKTCGCGTFEVEDITNKTQALFRAIMHYSNSYKVLLSRYIPSKEELDKLNKQLVAYKIGISRGWITSGRISLPFKRRGIRFLKEGSVFKGNLEGTLLDVTPENIILSHKIYRYGIALTIPWK